MTKLGLNERIMRRKITLVKHDLMRKVHKNEKAGAVGPGSV
jgi:hypothetical protein